MELVAIDPQIEDVECPLAGQPSLSAKLNGVSPFALILLARSIKPAQSVGGVQPLSDQTLFR